MIGITLALKPAELVLNRALSKRDDREQLMRGLAGRSLLIRHSSGLGVGMLFSVERITLQGDDQGNYDLSIEGDSSALFKLLSEGEPPEGLKVNGELRIARALMHVADALWLDISEALLNLPGPLLGGAIQQLLRELQRIMSARQAALKTKLSDHLNAENGFFIGREELEQHANNIDLLRRRLSVLEVKRGAKP